MVIQLVCFVGLMLVILVNVRVWVWYKMGFSGLFCGLEFGERYVGFVLVVLFCEYLSLRLLWLLDLILVWSLVVVCCVLWFMD